jgi:hypothetical protein
LVIVPWPGGQAHLNGPIIGFQIYIGPRRCSGRDPEFGCGLLDVCGAPARIATTVTRK